MPGSLIVRPSICGDIPAITDIYAFHVRNGAATFEIDPPDIAEMSRRGSEIAQCRLPYLVAELGGSIRGYAYASPYRPRAAYRFTVEDSIYIHPGHTGQGIGSALLAQLIELCEQGGWRQMLAVIGDGNNSASVQLHRRFGFEDVGTLRSVGFKFGRWVDTVLMQRPLGSGDLTVPDRPCSHTSGCDASVTRASASEDGVPR